MCAASGIQVSGHCVAGGNADADAEPRGWIATCAFAVASCC